VTEHLAETLDRLEPIARDLGCERELQDVEGIVRRGAGYQRQRRVAEANGGNLRAVVLEEARLMREGHSA
jgi:carboxylate-amine ligase